MDLRPEQDILHLRDRCREDGTQRVAGVRQELMVSQPAEEASQILVGNGQGCLEEGDGFRGVRGGQQLKSLLEQFRWAARDRGRPRGPRHEVGQLIGGAISMQKCVDLGGVQFWKCRVNCWVHDWAPVWW